MRPNRGAARRDDRGLPDLPGAGQQQPIHTAAVLTARQPPRFKQTEKIRQSPLITDTFIKMIKSF